jgi:hypothetical protein
MKSRSRILQITLLALAALAIAAPAAQAMPLIGASAAVATPPQIRALALRSEGMNQLYSPSQAIRAIELRSQALNQAYGLGTAATDSVRVSTTKDGFNWTDGALGAAGVFGAVLVLAVAILVTRRNHHAPLGV